MRLTPAAVALAIMLGSFQAHAQRSSAGFDPSNFNLKTAEDLYNICTVDTSNPNARVAKAFCYGYFAGGAHYHAAISAIESIKPIACPGAGVTRDEAVSVFTQFFRANPQKAGEKPMDVVFEAIASRWPCPAKE